MRLSDHQDDGLFSRIGGHASELWSNGRNVWAEESRKPAESASSG